MDSEDIPTDFVCSLSGDVFCDPVSTLDGQTYERGMIEEHFAVRRRGRLKMTSPLTNAVLEDTRLIPNISLRNAIAAWRERLPMALSPENLRLNDDEPPLGHGSYGRVVPGVLTVRGANPIEVAVKTLPGLPRGEQRAMLEKELRVHLAAQRASGGVCQLLGTCEKGGQLCIVMKRYVTSLRDRLAGRPLPLQDALRYAAPLARALADLHGAGIILRDIKPENVLLDRFGAPVFADFGISDIVTRSTGIRQTQVKGTFSYLAPEAFDGTVDQNVDIWAFAAMVVEMLSGKPPFAGLQLPAIMKALCIDKQAPDVPPGLPLTDILRNCFSHAPAERPFAEKLAARFAMELEVPGDAGAAPAPPGAPAGPSAPAYTAQVPSGTPPKKQEEDHLRGRGSSTNEEVRRRAASTDAPVGSVYPWMTIEVIMN